MSFVASFSITYFLSFYVVCRQSSMFVCNISCFCIFFNILFIFPCVFCCLCTNSIIYSFKASYFLSISGDTSNFPYIYLIFLYNKKEKYPLPHVYFSFSLSSLHMIFKFVLKFFQTHSGLLFFYDTRKSSENFVSFSVFPCSFRSLRIVRI